MKEYDASSSETQAILGLDTLALTRIIVRAHPEIAKVSMRIYHYTPNAQGEEPIFTLTRNEFTSSDLPESLSQVLMPGWNMNMDSSVILESGETAHIPMMDLDVKPKGAKSVEFIENILTEQFVPQFGGGYIIESGKSYQYIGKELLSQSQLHMFLGQFLLACPPVKVAQHLSRIVIPFADTRYIGHILQRGDITGLRLTTNGHKTFVPKVVAVL